VTRRFSATLLSLAIAVSASADTKQSPFIGSDEEVRPPKELPPALQQKPEKTQPWIVRMMIHEVPMGMFIGLPIVDTNPNKGTTYGFMPIYVVQPASKRIEHILAPSITYNPTFKAEATMRYYWYPSERANYFVRAAVSGNQNQDVIGEMEDLDFLGRGIALSARVAFDVDGSKRFFGIGPDSHESHETNFTRKTVGYYARFGIPIFKDSHWKFNFSHALAGERIAPGVIESIATIQSRFPENAPTHFHQDSRFQLFMDYDTRDSAITTSRGTYLKFLIENAQTELGSEFAFQRYGMDARGFLPWEDRRFGTTAARFRYEQLQGKAPFYLLSSLGGKETLRAYGEGRFIDRGMWVSTVEQRFTVFDATVTDVTVEMEIAPFFGLGTVFSTPGRISSRYMRPAYGVAFRAVTRPQVVGSIDLGFGQEGPSVFMDINYSF
jgi:hypothetical protein